MSSVPKVSLEQWQAFLAVIHEGSYAKAAKKLHKTQPTVSYLVKRIEEILEVRLFESQGRQSILTAAGERIRVYAASLVQSAQQLELNIKTLAGDEPRLLRLAIDEIFPLELLLATLNTFSITYPVISLEIHHGILSGPIAMYEKGHVDFAITFSYPKNILAEKICSLESTLYTATNHPLQNLGRAVTKNDLLENRQIVVMDSSVERKEDFGWLSSAPVYRVSSLELKYHCLQHGLGYAWLNKNYMKAQIHHLKPLHMAMDTTRHHDLYIVHRDEHNDSLILKSLVALFKKQATLLGY